MKLKNVLYSLIDEKIIKILALFFTKKSYSFNLSEVTKYSGVSKASSFRILKKLSRMGLVEVEEIKSIKLYSLSREAPVAELEEVMFPKKSINEKIVDLSSQNSAIEKVILMNSKKNYYSLIIVLKSISDFEKKDIIEKKFANLGKEFKFYLDLAFMDIEQYRKFNSMGMYKDMPILYNK